MRHLKVVNGTLEVLLEGLCLIVETWQSGAFSKTIMRASVLQLPRGVNRDWNQVYTSLELCRIIFEFSPSFIVFYLEMKVEVEVDVHDIRSRFTPRAPL